MMKKIANGNKFEILACFFPFHDIIVKVGTVLHNSVDLYEKKVTLWLIKESDAHSLIAKEIDFWAYDG